jgi:transcription initiation factor TFIIH subunit 1
LNETPPEKIILDIQDTRRYFESQTGGLDLMRLNEEDTSQLLRGYKRRFEGWQPEMAKQVMQSHSADQVCVELTNTIKRKIRHDDKSTADIKLPPPVQQKIQNYHSLTNEILRHFWSSYEPYKADKNLRMVESLKKQQEKLKEVLIAVVSYEGDPEKCKQV